MSKLSKLPEGFYEHDFLSMMKREAHARNRIRLLAMHHVQLGKTLKEIAEIVQVHWKTVQVWVRHFRLDSFTGLFESQRSGASRKLNAIHESFLADKITKLSESKTGGYITGRELHQMLVEEYDVKCSLKTVYNTLHRLGFSWITSRSQHPKANRETQTTYKKTSPTG